MMQCDWPTESYGRSLGGNDNEGGWRTETTLKRLPGLLGRRRHGDDGVVFVDNNCYPTDKFIGLMMGDLENEPIRDEFCARFGMEIHRLAMLAFRTYLNHCSDQEADDLVQEVYQHLLENGCQTLRNFQGETENAFLGYLAIVCLNLARDQRRRSRTEMVREPSSAEVPDNSALPLDCYPAVEPDQERALLRRELRDRIDDILRQSSQSKHAQRDSQVFMLRYFNEYSAKEVAVVLKIAPSLVDTIYPRIKEKVEIELAKVLRIENIKL